MRARIAKIIMTALLTVMSKRRFVFVRSCIAGIVLRKISVSQIGKIVKSTVSVPADTKMSKYGSEMFAINPIARKIGM